MSRIAHVPPTRVEIIPRRSFTVAEREMVLNRQDGLCGCCGRPLAGIVWHIDHVTALALGGLHGPENWQALDFRCHALKTALDIAAIAKCKRLSGETGQGPKRKIPSRPFQKRIKR